MVSELKNIIVEVEQLSKEKQVEIARLIEDEIRWENILQKTHHELSNLAEEALNDYHKGKSTKEDW